MVQPWFRNQLYVSPKCARRSSISSDFKDSEVRHINLSRTGFNIGYRVRGKVPIFCLEPFLSDIEFGSFFLFEPSLDGDVLGQSDSCTFTADAEDANHFSSQVILAFTGRNQHTKFVAPYTTSIVLYCNQLPFRVEVNSDDKRVLVIPTHPQIKGVVHKLAQASFKVVVA